MASGTKQKIFIEGKFTSLNKYIDANRVNRYKGAKIKKSETFAAYIQAKASGVKFETPCNIKFTWYISDLRTDPDNVASAKKFILDGMVQAGVIPDDKYKQILGFTDTFELSKNKIGVMIERV